MLVVAELSDVKPNSRPEETMRQILIVATLAGCSSAELTLANHDPFADSVPTGRQAPPTLTLSAPADVLAAEDVTITVTGAGDGEPVYVGWSVGDGPPRCPRVAGGLCLDIPGPTYLLGVADADASGTATLQVRTPTCLVPPRSTGGVS
jgi:hypothetical protein